ncbi:MAG: type II toxin-antitoxin system prevent-host-death family antitoxin [Gemmatimonadales bacterium]
MKTVGIRSLKAHLSQYLRDVRGGEEILVTDRGEVVAEIRAPRPESSLLPVDRALRALGQVVPIRVGEPHHASVYGASPVKAAPGTARQLLDAERDSV